jgi:hypothetical protein
VPVVPARYRFDLHLASIIAIFTSSPPGASLFRWLDFCLSLAVASPRFHIRPSDLPSASRPPLAPHSVGEMEHSQHRPSAALLLGNSRNHANDFAARPRPNAQDRAVALHRPRSRRHGIALVLDCIRVATSPRSLYAVRRRTNERCAGVPRSATPIVQGPQPQACHGRRCSPTAYRRSQAISKRYPLRHRGSVGIELSGVTFTDALCDMSESSGRIVDSDIGRKRLSKRSARSTI